MKYLVVLLLLATFTVSEAQKIGKMAPEKEPMEFPSNAWGMDLMFGDGGFGLGTFLRQRISEDFTGFIDLSFSETKDNREVEFYDYYYDTFVPGKVNRSFLIPVTVGVHYHLFRDAIVENLRPYFNVGVGPTFVITTPYEREFFSSFGKAQVMYAYGGYVGFGANFGLSKSQLVGINIRYYYTHIPGDGIENLRDKYRKNIGSFYITLNLGLMY